MIGGSNSTLSDPAKRKAGAALQPSRARTRAWRAPLSGFDRADISLTSRQTPNVSGGLRAALELPLLAFRSLVRADNDGPTLANVETNGARP